MSTPKLIMFLAFMFLSGLIISNISSGTWIGASDITTMNTLTVIRSYDVAGLFSVPWINIDFFVIGVPKLVAFDYSFFGGEARLIQYFFLVVTIGFIFGILPIVIGVLQIIRG